MHPHLLLATAETITQERLAHAARRRLALRGRRRATALDRIGQRLARFGATARRRAGSVGAPDAEPATCTGAGGAWST